MSVFSLPQQDIKRDIKNRLCKGRYEHSLRVAEEAVRLAEIYDQDLKKAQLTGLLHDYAKCLSNKKLCKLAPQSGWEIDNIEMDIVGVLHAPVGAFLVQKKYGITDQQFLQAIRYHTIGSPNMDQFACLVFIADFIEAGRDFPGINRIRSYAYKDWKQALVAICEHVIKYNIERKKLIHPNTLLLRNAYLGGKL